MPIFKRQREEGKVTITDARMTRFWITLEQGVHFVLRCLENMHGGEVFVPKIPSMNLMDLKEAIAPGCEAEQIGIQPGEKLHEVLVSEDEAHQTVELDDMYIIRPTFPWWGKENWNEGKQLPEGFRYASDTNSHMLPVEAMRSLVL